MNDIDRTKNTYREIMPVMFSDKNNMGYETVCAIIDAERARELLNCNFSKNRRISTQTVTKYAEDMKNGNWMPSACEPIVISSTGKVINGQHRLCAVIKANVAIPMEIRMGVDEKAYQFFDQGKKRSVADAIDVKNRKNISAICNYALSIAYFGGFNGSAKRSIQNDKVTKSGIIDMYSAIENTHPGLLDECVRVAKKVYRYGWIQQAAGTGLLAMYLANSDVAKNFFEDLFDDMPKNKTFYSLFTYALNGKINLYKPAVRKHLTVYALSKCWNTYFGAEPTKIKYSEKSTVNIIGFDIEMFRQFAPQTRKVEDDNT